MKQQHYIENYITLYHTYLLLFCKQDISTWNYYSNKNEETKIMLAKWQQFKLEIISHLHAIMLKWTHSNEKLLQQHICETIRTKSTKFS